MKYNITQIQIQTTSLFWWRVY